MTTNHVERLDPALVRPGRVDLSELFDDATPEQAKNLFTQFYGNTDQGNEEIENMGRMLLEIVQRERREGKTASMASLQGLFIRSSAREALENCRSIFVAIKR